MNKKKISLLIVVSSLLIVALFVFFVDLRPSLAHQYLKDINGNVHQLVNGQPMIVNIWATDCPSCVDEMPKLQSMFNDYQSDGFRVIGVAMQYDRLEAIHNFINQLGVNFPIVYDEEGSVIPQIADVYVLPMSFLVDQNAKVVAQSIGEPNWLEWREIIESMLDEKA